VVGIVTAIADDGRRVIAKRATSNTPRHDPSGRGGRRVKIARRAPRNALEAVRTERRKPSRGPAFGRGLALNPAVRRLAAAGKLLRNRFS